MDPHSVTLPLPDPAALEQSRRLAAVIDEALAAARGWIGFERYMQLALYEPGLGYYTGGSTKFGTAGDFVTAPELGDTLARAIAASLGRVFDVAAPAVLELGAGSGKLAAQLLDALARLGHGHVEYRILEPSAELRQRQRARLARFGGRVKWLDRLPDAPFDGLVLANEVVDALPVACFVKRGGRAVPLGVRRDADGFAWAEGRGDARLEEAVAALEAKLPAPLADGYRSEIRLTLPAWIASLGAVLRRGAVLLVDYGYGRHEYYHPSRSSGTLICHYRHRAHDDPFLYPGIQDITAWVDFSAAADAALEAGLSVAGYTTQGQFLVETLRNRLLEPPDLVSPQALSALKTLVLPGEMGERFKALLLAKNLDDAMLPGRDLRGRLFI